MHETYDNMIIFKNTTHNLDPRKDHIQKYYDMIVMRTLLSSLVRINDRTGMLII